MAANVLEVNVGSRIRLNDSAREWTRGLVFVVTNLRPWGVLCTHEQDQGLVSYRAQWDEIGEVLRDGGGRSDVG